MPDAQSLHAIRTALGQRSVVLVGLMGCGKSAIGRRLAAKLGAAVRRRRRGDREGGRQEHRGHFRRSRRAVLPRRRAQGAGAAAALGPAGAGNRRRRLHERGDAGAPSPSTAISVWLQGRAAAARAPRRQARQPSAAQGRGSRGRAAEPHDDALSGLCAGRSSPSKAATCRTRSSSPRSSSVSASIWAPPPRWPDERDSSCKTFAPSTCRWATVLTTC